MSHQDLVIHNALIASTSTANALIVGDIINGPGIPIGSIVLEINYVSNGVWEILIDKDFVIEDVYATGNHIPYLDPNNPIYSASPLVQWPTEIFITPSTSAASKTLTYKEDVKGWVSFKSFTPENAISCANEYYTFNQGKAWRHHDENVLRNTFYGTFTSNAFSSFTVVLNDSPGSVKSFNTLNYEGSQSRVTPNLQDNDYYNLNPKKGWHVDSIFTNKEKGSLNEFIEKEGKWFNYIKGKVGSTVGVGGITSGFDNADFAFQGLGLASIVTFPTVIVVTPGSTVGCTNSAANNYDANANVDDGNCFILGCTDSNADSGYDSNNQNITVDTNPTSCGYEGCTDPNQLGYDPNANTDDGTCVAVVNGCMDELFNAAGLPVYNYNDAANVQLVDSCVAWVYGCTQSNAINHNDNATFNDGSCLFSNSGCTSLSACNYDFDANVDDGSCVVCEDVAANNYDGNTNTNVCVDNSGCLYCNVPMGIIVHPAGYNAMDGETQRNISWVTAMYSSAIIFDFTIVVTSQDGNHTFTVTSDGSNYGILIDGLSENTTYNLTIQANCQNTSSPLSVVETFTTDAAAVPTLGCTDSTALNFDASADTDDNSCVFCEYGCTDQTQYNYNGTSTCEDGSCITFVFGCTDPAAFNYDENANTDNLSCEAFVYGCTDDNANNTDDDANTNAGGSNLGSGVCNYDIPGCTDPSANNVTVGNANQTVVDDGSCTYDVYGCTDPAASNYDAAANIDDNTCTYTPIYGCMDSSLANNNIDYAATNYAGVGNTIGVTLYANTDDGTCEYTMPVLAIPDVDYEDADYSLYTQPWPYGNQGNGWYLSGIWGTRRKLKVIWDVSKSPKFAPHYPGLGDKPFKIAYHQSFDTSGNVGDINNFAVADSIKSAGAFGSVFVDHYGFTNQDTFNFLELDPGSSKLHIEYVNNLTSYPPYVSEGTQQLRAQFIFASQTSTNADLSTNTHLPGDSSGMYESPITDFDVVLGCTDSTPISGDDPVNFLGATYPFADDSLCADTTTFNLIEDPVYWGGYTSTFENEASNVQVHDVVGGMNAYSLKAKKTLGYNAVGPWATNLTPTTLQINQDVNSAPIGYSIRSYVVSSEGEMGVMNTSPWDSAPHGHWGKRIFHFMNFTNNTSSSTNTGYQYEPSIVDPNDTNYNHPSQGTYGAFLRETGINSGVADSNSEPDTQNLIVVASSIAEAKTTWIHTQVKPIISWPAHGTSNSKVWGTTMNSWNQAGVGDAVQVTSFPNSNSNGFQL